LTLFLAIIVSDNPILIGFLFNDEGKVYEYEIFASFVNRQLQIGEKQLEWDYLRQLLLKIESIDIKEEPVPISSIKNGIFIHYGDRMYYPIRNAGSSSDPKTSFRWIEKQLMID
jgi:hypothetical protein